MLSYISPEQTGRINRSVDHRADLYSFGAILYELFTGGLPFQAKDPSELIYSHLAQIPQAPSELNSELPTTVADIIMRLLAKNPDDRYQSSFGVRTDLTAVLEQLRQTGKIREINLGLTDYSSLFQLPDRLYDRETELQTLQTEVHHAGEESGTLVIISGRAGSGKSALVEAQGQYRFHHLLRSFILSSARRQRPLVLFLDNMQWADQASLQLLDLLLPDIHNRPILLIIAYRDDEVRTGHPLSTLLETLSPKQLRCIS
jgi:serine/threonine protein kinase